MSDVDVNLSIDTDAFVGAIREAALAVDELLRATSVVYAAGYEIKIKHGRKILAERNEYGVEAVGEWNE